QLHILTIPPQYLFSGLFRRLALLKLHYEHLFWAFSPNNAVQRFIWILSLPHSIILHTTYADSVVFMVLLVFTKVTVVGFKEPTSAITPTDEILRPSTILLSPSSVLPSMVEFMNFEIN
ncbi:hypothetical protein L9F63_001375, partial [Diploptera punctata]